MLFVQDILKYILNYVFGFQDFNKCNKKEKLIIRTLLNENKNFKRLNHKKGFILKINLNNTYNLKLDYASIKNNNFKIVKFQELLTLYSENYYKKSPFFNLIKDINLVPFIKYDYDIAYLYLIMFNKKDYNLILNNLNKIISFKYKASFTKKERKLLYILKNKEYYSSIQVNETSYKDLLENKIIELETNIKELETNIKELETNIKEFSSKEINTIFIETFKFKGENKYRNYLLETNKIFENKVLFDMKQDLKDLNLDLIDLKQELLETRYKLDSYITSIDYNQENTYSVNYIPTRTNKNFKRYEYY